MLSWGAGLEGGSYVTPSLGCPPQGQHWAGPHSVQALLPAVLPAPHAVGRGAASTKPALGDHWDPRLEQGSSYGRTGVLRVAGGRRVLPCPTLGLHSGAVRSPWEAAAPTPK